MGEDFVLLVCSIFEFPQENLPYVISNSVFYRVDLYSLQLVSHYNFYVNPIGHT